MEDGHILDCDIIIRKEEIIIEFDGSYWHGSDQMYKRDLAKTETLSKAGWRVIRVREEPLESISADDVSMPLRQDMKLTANSFLLKIQEILGNPLAGINEYLVSPNRRKSKESKAFADLLMKRSSDRRNAEQLGDLKKE
jgi:hypothetical protein